MRHRAEARASFASKYATAMNPVGGDHGPVRFSMRFHDGPGRRAPGMPNNSRASSLGRFRVISLGFSTQRLRAGRRCV